MTISVLNTQKTERKLTWDKYGRRNMKMSEYYAKPRLYLSIDMGEDGYAGAASPMEHILFDRYSARELAKFTRDSGFLPEILRQAGLPEDTKATFSQKAGCSCGCSPALILTAPGYFTPFDLWATIGDADLVEAAKPWREASRYLMARKAGRAILQNAHLSGLRKVELKKLKTWFSTEKWHTPFQTA